MTLFTLEREGYSDVVFLKVVCARIRILVAITEKDNGKMSVSLEFEASILSDGKRDGKV